MIKLPADKYDRLLAITQWSENAPHEVEISEITETNIWRVQCTFFTNLDVVELFLKDGALYVRVFNGDQEVDHKVIRS